MYYKLVNRIPVKCHIGEYLKLNKKDLRVDYSVFGDVTVSTVFLGLDHGYNGQVLLFETMIFGGEHDGYQERYTTWEEAVSGHKIACDMVNKVAIERDNKLNDLGV